MRSVRLDLHFNPGSLSVAGQHRFRTGELLSGWLDVECPEPTPCRALSVNVVPHVLGPSLPQGYYPVAPSLLFRGELPAGRHRFPFSLWLPVGPVSYEGEYGSLSWRLQAHLDRGAPVHDLLLPAATDELFQLVAPGCHEGVEREQPGAAELAVERLVPRRQVPWLEAGADPGFLATLASDLRRAFKLAAPLLIAPKALRLGDAFDVYCLWPQGWAPPGRVDVEVFAQESRVTYPNGNYMPPLIEHAYPFGIATDLGAAALEDVPAIADTVRKQFGTALQARLQLPQDALPTHPLISWGVRLRARTAGKKPRNVVAKERLWECERSLQVSPWWEGAVGKAAASASQTHQLTPTRDKSAEVSVAA